jgi:nitrogen fixation protein NifX
MSQSTLSRELALGIGLAAKALPATEPKQLIEALTSHLGLPLTELKLRDMTLSQYQNLVNKSVSEHYDKAQLRHSLDYLQSVTAADKKIEAYHDGDMPHSIRLAIASEDGYYVNAQFSLCSQFYVYQLSGQEYRLIAIRDVVMADDLKAEQKQLYRAELIKDCQVLYSLAIGGKAAAKVVKAGVHPMKLNDEVEINEIIKQLQQVLDTSPPPWLAKSMGLPQTTIHQTVRKKAYD